MKKFFSSSFFSDFETQRNAAIVDLGLDSKKYNIAMIGYGKTGHSTLLNTLSSKIDDVEMPQKLLKYEIPSLPDVVIWDLLGTGKQKQGNETKYKKTHLCGFDFCIILVQMDLTKDETHLAQEALKMGQPVIFVHTRTDMTLQYKFYKDRSRTPITQNDADKLIDELSIKFGKILKEINDTELEKIKVFFISAVIMQDILNGIVPEYHFQEKEFLREIKVASECNRGKKGI